MKDDLGIFLDDWGDLIGAILTFTPPLWDVLKLGWFSFYDWRVGQWGIVCMLLGGLVSLLTWIARKFF